MIVGLIDNELNTRTNNSFPNLAIMKLSSYYKNKGCDVKLISFEEINPNNLFTTEFDLIFISKVFSDTFTPEFVNDLPNVIKGGSGFYYDKAPKLSYDIEHSFPDYNIYTELKGCKNDYYHKYSIGFITRGCVRRCDFCINKNSKKVEYNSKLSEFVDKKRPYIMLLDDNITAYSGFYDVFDELNKLQIPFVFKQGMDFRLLNPKKMNILWNSNYRSTDKKNGTKGGRVFHFAFDDISDYNIIKKRLKEYYYNKPYSFGVIFYVLVGFDKENKYDNIFFENDINDLFIRIQLLFKYSAYPYIMLHENIDKNPKFKLIKTLRNIINDPKLVTNKTIREAIIQSNKLELLTYLNDNHKWFLDLFFNSKLYKKHY